MKEKILKILKSNIFFAVVINVAIMFLCIGISSFSYDSSDDFYNSLLICQNHYYYSSEINYIYATIAGIAQFILPNFNCFVLSQVLLSCVAFISISYICADKFSKPKSLFFTLVINILFALNHYADILSSKTAALLIAAGFLLALNAIRNKRYNLPFWIGLVEILLGSFLCYSYLFVGLAFSIAFFLGDMIAKRKYKQPFRKFFWYFRPFVLVFIFIMILGIGAEYLSYSANHSSDEASNYYEYSELCDRISQYPFPDYTNYQEQFSEIGVSSDDYEMLRNGYYDADNALSNTALKLVKEIQQKEHSYNVLTDIGNISYDVWSHITSFDCIAYVLVYFVLASVLYIVIHKKRLAFFPVFYLLIGFASSLFIRYFLNSSAYNMYGIWLMMCLFLVYSFDFENIKTKENIMVQGYKKSTVFVWSAVVLIMFLSYCFVYQSNLKPAQSSKPSTLYTEINRHPERYYIFDPASFDEYISKCNNYNHPLWGIQSNFIDNVDGFKYFHRQAQLVKRNLPTNIYEAVLTQNNIFVVDKNIIFKKEKYLNSYYVEDGTNAYYAESKELDGFKIYSIITE